MSADQRVVADAHRRREQDKLSGAIGQHEMRTDRNACAKDYAVADVEQRTVVNARAWRPINELADARAPQPQPG